MKISKMLDLERIVGDRTLSEEDKKQIIRDYAKKNGAVEIGSCAKCDSISNLTFHHLHGRRKFRDKVHSDELYSPNEDDVPVKGDIILEVTRNFLGVSLEEALYSQMKQKPLIYLCKTCHRELNLWYSNICKKYMGALMDEIQKGYKGSI